MNIRESSLLSIPVMVSRSRCVSDAGADANVILFRRDPSDLREGQKENAAPRLEGDAGRMKIAVAGRLCFLRSRAGSLSNTFACILKRGMETLGREGLKQVVGCLHLKGAHSILVVSRGDDDMRQ